MSFYEIITFITLINLPFFPEQDTIWVRYIVFAYAAYLLPIALHVIARSGATKQFLNRHAELDSASSETLKRIQGDRIGVIWAFLAFLTVGVLSTIFSTNLQTSYVQLLLFFSYFVIYLTSSSIFNTLEKKERLGLVLIGITTILSTISLYNTLILHYSSKLSRGVSFMWVYFGHNHISALLLFTIPLSFYFLKKYWNGANNFKFQIPNFKFLLILFATSYLLFAMLMTFARGSIIALLLSLLSTIFFFDILSQKQKIITIFTVWVIFLGTLTGVLIGPSPFGIPKYSQDLSNIFSEITNRSFYWVMAIQNGVLHPLLGTGLDTYRFLSFSTDELSKSTYTHNFFFQMLSDSGFAGFWTCIILVLIVLTKSFRKAKTAIKEERFFMITLWIGIFGSILNALVDFDWQLPTVFFFFWLLAGLF